MIDGDIRHLDFCDSCRRAVAAISSTHVSRPQGDALHPQLVSVMASNTDRYEFRRVMGAGGMGATFEAFDNKLMRPVAIKAMRGGIDPGVALREAHALAKIHHPNIVSVFDVVAADGELMLVKEYIRGTTLRAWASKPQSFAAKIDVLLQCAAALDVIADVGIVHRDVKPENILISDDGVVKLCDFGLAVAHELNVGNGVDTAEIGDVIAGTPAYMAPEQYQRGAVGAYTDQVGFGITAIELLSGQRPFVGDSIESMRSAICSGTQAPLPELSGEVARGWRGSSVHRG